MAPSFLADRERLRFALFLLVASGVSMALIGALAMVTHSPFVFPSLGPTAFMLFAAPLIVEASPRNVVGGYAIGVLCGAFAPLVFGLLQTPPDLEDVTWRRVGAIALAVALTMALMTLLGLTHPPAAAATLIVSLGLLRGPKDWAMMMGAVVVLLVIAGVINRIHGVRTPLWAPSPGSADPADAEP
jgi:CBS-domain-containing membrane protein